MLTTPANRTREEQSKIDRALAARSAAMLEISWRLASGLTLACDAGRELTGEVNRLNGILERAGAID